MATGHDIIVIGASAGGIEALSALTAELPAELPAALFVVVHTSAESPGYLADILQRAGRWPARMAADGDPIRPGRILVAPPDRHLLLSGDRVRLSSGPRENRTRPAIDPLFRSAAVAFTSRVVAIVLSGLLDDGAAGVRAVKRCGGKALVQDPGEARFPEMPRSALAAAPIDFKLPVRGMPEVLMRLAQERPAPPPKVPEEVLWEVRMTLEEPDKKEFSEMPGSNSDFSCPECGGVLRAMADAKVPRFRCHTGHAYTLLHLLQEQGTQIEDALWAALRRLEEHDKLLTQMAQRVGQRTAESYRRRAEETRAHAEQLRRLLQLATASGNLGGLQ
jgi:two-component system, chemotaxis family, protein-glutamate methylesterase/glutaminase